MGSRWQSLNRKLPLLIALLLAATVTALSITALNRLRATLLAAAGERLQVVSQPVVRLLQASVAQRGDQLSRVASDPRTRAFLAGRTSGDAARAAFALAPHGTTGPGYTALRDTAGRLVLRDDSGAARPAPTPWVADLIARRTLAPHAVRVSPIEAQGDSLYIDMVIAVPAAADSTRLGGYVNEHRQVVGRGVQDIRDLIGRDAEMILGAPGSGVWTDLTRRTPPPPHGIAPGHAVSLASAPGGGIVGAATAVPGTPWVLWVQQPWSSVLGALTSFRRTLIELGLFFVVLGVAVGAILSRRITRPLTGLTRSAEDLAVRSGGAVSAPDTPAARDTRDEVARLSDSFDRMAARIDGAHQELERRVAERTQELESALDTLRDTQERLVQSERLAILGRLASAVGHELRNPLGVMTNAVFVLESVLPDAPPMARDYLGILRGQIAVSERIVGDLLDTARSRPPQRAPLSLEALTAEQLQRLGPLPGITVRCEFETHLPHAVADPTQVAQIVLNLLSNAVQAMGDRGGVLTIAGRHDAADQVILEVRDTGGGVPADLRGRVFEPLFTTKARGLGLGLWVSRTLAVANGGDLRLANQLGPGAVFVLELPATNGGGAAPTAGGGAS